LWGWLAAEKPPFRHRNGVGLPLDGEQGGFPSVEISSEFHRGSALSAEKRIDVLEVVTRLSANQFELHKKTPRSLRRGGKVGWVEEI
jgi:hypothetical protein